HLKRLSPEEEFNHVLQAARCVGTRADHLARLEAALAEAKHGDRSGMQDKFDPLHFHREFLRDFLHKDPYLASIEDSETAEESGFVDIATLYHVGLCVFASDDSVPIELHFADLIEQEGVLNQVEIGQMLFDIQGQLALRTAHAQAAFGALTKPCGTSVIAPLELLNARTRTAKEKGDILENATAQIFSDAHGFSVRSKHRRGDEEIDLVIVNKQSDPFWLALQSPIIIAECRNRMAKVRARDLRDFETKLRNCGSICKLGLIVSTSGFTRECSVALKRLSREGYRIVLVDQVSIHRRLAENVPTKDWLEELIVEQL
ncbi:MAG: restriction endonuclease, partial [Candidatus Binatia bacterium]